MKKYIVNYEDFYKYSKEQTENVKETMNQLINKFDLKNKDILAVAPGIGIEEYWFYRSGSHLTFVDIDLQGTLEPFLKQISLTSPSSGLIYYIGDAGEYLTISDSTFDVLYISSLTNDEKRRGEIIKKYRYWPSDQYPYNSLVQDLADKKIKKGGLFIYQSYYGCVDVSNPLYLKLLKEQLANIGIILLKVYAFKSSPGVSLTIGIKGNQIAALNYLEKIKNNPEITKFHGRSKFSEKGCQIIYQLSGEY